MKFWVQRSLAAAIAVAFAFVVVSLDAAPAQAKSKSIQTEANWIKFDPTAKTVTVKVRKPGTKKDKSLKKNKEATFKVKPEGSVLTKTTVSVNGRKGELVDIPEGKQVNIYWVPDEADDSVRFARKIDVVLSEEELMERYGVDDDE